MKDSLFFFPCYHFLWILGLFGGISTVIYPAFINQGPTIFYLPTISGLIHHSLSATLVIALLLLKQIHITYKKWYCTLFGFTCYLSLGAFLIGFFGLSDAFHIYTPLLSDTPLTTWVMAPIYAVCYTLIILIIELIRKYKKKKNPVIDRVVQRIFIPNGIWYDYSSGKKFTGNKYYMNFYKDEDYPIFIKEGSIIPMSLDKDTNCPKNMEIQIFPAENGLYGSL